MRFVFPLEVRILPVGNQNDNAIKDGVMKRKKDVLQGTNP
jgi:hypothetical protein